MLWSTFRVSCQSLKDFPNCVQVLDCKNKITLCRYRNRGHSWEKKPWGFYKTLIRNYRLLTKSVRGSACLNAWRLFVLENHTFFMWLLFSTLFLSGPILSCSFQTFAPLWVWLRIFSTANSFQNFSNFEIF